MEAPNEYQLTAEERQHLLDLNTQRANWKVQIHDLNMQLEQMQKQRDAADALFAGAASGLAIAHGMPGAQITPDLTKLVKGA